MIAAHLILGGREEPFLGALLRSLENVVDSAIVNDNGPGDSPHAPVLAASAFARGGRLHVDRTPFSNFAAARNVCLQLHRERQAGEWIAFVDADEVHGESAARIARHLRDVPPSVAAVDGYTWHFFGSFDWYTSIERRMAFFRYSDALRWTGAVHEQLDGLDGRRVVLPYVYGHYGHTLEVRRHAEKGRQYADMGAPGDIVPEYELADLDPERYYAAVFPRLLHFTGEHPPAVRPTIADLTPRLDALHDLTEHRARAQSPLVRIRNAVRKLNYEQRWRLRAVDPLARRLLRP